jgi:hypothetical protein
MTQEIINVGAAPNDGEGDPLRTAFQKINNNFTQLYSTGFFTSSAYSTGLTANQVIFESPVETFTQGIFQINSNDTASTDTENIVLNVSVINDGSGLKWNGHNTLFNGNVLTGYNMDIDIASSNVRILVNPIVDTTMFHFISAQITWTGVPVMGLNITTESAVMPENILTENDAFNITTQNQTRV